MKKFTLLLSLVLLFTISTSAITRPTAAASYAGGDGTGGNPYQISNISELLRFSTVASSNAAHKNTYFVLTANIDASESKDWTGNYPSLANFQGNLDGGCFAIDSLCLRDASFIGLVKRTPTGNTIGVNSGVIKNIGITNIDLYSEINANLGGIADKIETNAIISRCYVTGSIKGKQNTGGLAGRAAGGAKFEDCYVRANSTRHNDALLANGGGIIGQANGPVSITRCYFSGKSYRPIIKENGNTVTMSDVFYDGDSSTVKEDLLPDLALTTAEMATEASFTNWDFDAVWEMSSDGYPVLRTPVYNLALDYDATLGTVTGMTDGLYPVGENFSLQATAEGGTSFGGWYVNNENVSSDMNYTFTSTTENTTIYAHFKNNNSIQDLYYYNDFNFVDELIVTAKNTFASGWYGYQGGGNGSQVFGALEKIGNETYQKIDWNADAIYSAGDDVADVEMEMSFQAITDAPGVDFLLRAGSSDRKTAINVVLKLQETEADSISVSLNDPSAPILAKASASESNLVKDTEYLFKVVLKGNLLEAWVTPAGIAYTASPQLQYIITGNEGFLNSGKFGFGLSDAEAARFNYIKVGAPSMGTPTKLKSTNVNIVSIFPNPVNNSFTFKTLEAATVSVCDLNGREILSPIKVLREATISVASLKSGLYFVKTESNSGTKLTKLIVK